MNSYLRMSLCGIVLLGLAGSALAQRDKATTKPKQAKSEPKPMTVTVGEVSGTAHRLIAGKDKKWVALKADDKLDEMTIIRTGFRTKVVLVFADNSEVTIERATKMGIREFRKEGKVTKTTLGLKYGSLRATVKKTGGAKDFRIVTPVATAAARGSRKRAEFSGDFGFQMKCLSGKWNVKKGRKTRRLTKGEITNNRLAKSIRLAMKKATPIIGDVTGGLSKKEIKYIRGNRGGLGFTPGNAMGKKIVKRHVPKPIIRKITKPKPKPCVHTPGLDITIGE